MSNQSRERIAPALPSAGSAIWQVAGLTLRRARRGRLVQLVAVLLLLPVPAGLAALLSGHGGADFFDTVLNALLRFVTPLAMALFSGAMIAEEVQGKTITYLLSRPIPRWTLPVGKYFGTVAVTVALLAVSVTATYLVCAGSEILEALPRLGLALLTTALAAIHFGAVATAFGAMVTGYPFAAMLIFILIVDVGLGFIPGIFKAVSAGVNLTAVAGLYRPHTDTFFMADPKLTPAISLGIVAGLTAIWLLIAIGWVSAHEYRTDK